MAILDAREVVKEYRMGSGIVRALAGVSLHIEPGEFVAILGTSGSGKSTLLNLFGGLDRPTTGEVRFEGNSLAPLSAPALARHRLRHVGMVFQSFNLSATMTAWENIALALAFAGVRRAERRRRAEALLAQVGLADRSAHRPAELSGGEQQRVAIARALANEPRALLADEPTGNLDSTHAAEILGLLKAMQGAGKTIVLVTHDQDLARTYADRCVRLKDGKVVVT
jgi:ABC-type lipoprotein export system ATPase subunit